jgi:hypothetical protein
VDVPPKESPTLSSVLVSGGDSSFVPQESRNDAFSPAVPDCEASILSKWTVNALKAELKRRGLAGRGNKAELVARLAAENLSKGGNRVDSVASSVDGPDPRLVEEEPSAETVERELCRSTGLPWPHIDYASREDMPRGINWRRVPSGWRITISIRAIEHRLSTDLCLDDFPGYVSERPEVNYRRKPPLPAASDLDPLSDAFPRRRCPKPRVRNRRKDNRGDFRRGGSCSESPPDRSARVDIFSLMAIEMLMILARYVRVLVPLKDLALQLFCWLLQFLENFRSRFEIKICLF